MKNGDESLYLDILENGERRKESLHMTYFAGRDRITKMRNEETRRIAEQKARDMEDELNSIADGFPRQGIGMEREFFQFFVDCMKKHTNKNTKGTWVNTFNHLMKYEQDVHIPMRRISPRWVSGFKEYLLNNAVNEKSNKNSKGLSQNTACLYFMKLVTCLNEAHLMNYIKRNPTDGIKRIGQKQGTKNFLDVDELKLLMNTPCRSDLIKNMFLFCCMTGIRFNDAKSLTWGDVITKNESSYIDIVQQKTGIHIEIPLNDTALNLLGERRPWSVSLFEYVPTLCTCNENIADWVSRAGIKKHITFHCSRHTFACLTLLASGNLYTTSKLLGHTNIKTTEIYAKVMDSSKEQAVSALNNLL